MTSRSDKGWSHFRAAEALYQAELARTVDRQWTAFDYRMRQAVDLAIADGDSHLVGASLELQASRWEIAGYQGEVLAALGGALEAYRRLTVPEHRHRHSQRIKQRLDNWFSIPRVFVSYARADTDAVRAVVDHLTSPAVGAEVLWDVDMFVPGVDLSRLIGWAIGHIADPTRDEVTAVVGEAFRIAGIYMVMWSSTYDARPWTRWELEVASEHLASLRTGGRTGPRIVFACLDDHPVPTAYRGALWIDLRNGLDGAGRALLARAVTRTDLLGPRS